MRITLIIFLVLAIIFVSGEIIGNVIAKKAKSRFDKMSPAEQRKCQEQKYKAQQLLGC